MDYKELDRRYNQFFGLGNHKGLADEHLHPETLSNSRLMAELDDVIQVLSQATNAEYVQMHQTDPGRAASLIMREIRNRLHVEESKE